MDCRQFHELIFRQRDQNLSAEETSRLAEHVATCPDCRQLQAGLAEAADVWRRRTQSAVTPDPNVEWQIVRQRLRGGSVARRRSSWLTWASLPAAAALAVLLWTRGTPETVDRSADASPTPAAEFVEAGDLRATPVVYVDEESGWLIVWASAPQEPVRG